MTSVSEIFLQMMIIIVVNTYCALLLHLALHTSKDEPSNHHNNPAIVFSAPVGVQLFAAA